MHQAVIITDNMPGFFLFQQWCDVFSNQGAPEGVIDRCAFVRIGTEKVPMTPALKAEINKHVKFYGTGKKRWLLQKNYLITSSVRLCKGHLTMMLCMVAEILFSFQFMCVLSQFSALNKAGLGKFINSKLFLDNYCEIVYRHNKFTKYIDDRLSNLFLKTSMTLFLLCLNL